MMYALLAFALLTSIVAAQCLQGGDETTINDALSAGGQGAVIQLCPNSFFSINSAVSFTASGQEISTEGYPTDSSRATIQISASSGSLATAVSGVGLDGIQLLNLIVDGNREGAGKVVGGGASIELGGSASGQVISYVASRNPRAWSCMHIDEGQDDCTNATITRNDIGPCGNEGTDSNGNGNWADGISFACKDSFVAYNTVSGSTDGGIVIFGAPGTTVTQNTIVSSTTDRGWGAINMVDSTFNGNYADVIVSENNISGQLLFDCGICIGSSVWGEGGPIVLQGPASVTDNSISGNVAFPIALNGWTNGITIEGNEININNQSDFADDSSCHTAVQAIFGSTLIYYPPGVSGPQELQDGFDAAQNNVTYFLCANPSGPPSKTFGLAGLNSGPGEIAILHGGYVFYFQNDANFVVLEYLGGPAVWNSGTGTGTGTCSDCSVAFQGDGNFVIYNNGQAVFSTATNPSGNSFVLLDQSPWLQIEDGGGNVIWTTANGNALTG